MSQPQHNDPLNANNVQKSFDMIAGMKGTRDNLKSMENFVKILNGAPKKSIKNKKDVDELAALFNNELAKNKTQAHWLGFGNLVKLVWWSLFAKYRAVYFMRRVCDGMYYKIAWTQAKTKTKQEIAAILFNWEI
jgi:hypothetical protein